MVGGAIVDTSCCGVGGCAYALVPGFVVDWKYRRNEGGLAVSRVEPIRDEVIQGRVRRLIGPAEGAPNFAVRYFEVQPGGCTSLDQHDHDHGVLVLRGRGEVLLGQQVTELSFGDAVYVSPREVHQFRCIGDEPLGFLCVIPALESDTG